MYHGPLANERALYIREDLDNSPPMRLGWPCLLLFVGCAVEHTGLLALGEVDLGQDASADAAFALDAPGFDGAPLTDAGPSFDSASLDAGSGPVDAGRDAGPMDAGRDAGPMDAGPRDVGVDADLCTTGPDGDLDGVSDACDRCAGEDDRVDVDGDDIPDACDPWPCTDIATPPGTVSQEFIQVSNVRVGEGTNRSVADSGDSVRLRFDYTLNDTGCVGCPNQFEVGSQRAGRIGCIYDGTPPPGGVSDSVERYVTLGDPGVVELRFNLGRNASCAPFAGWWPMAPGPEHTFALICVR